MKRFVALVGAILILVGVRYYDSGLYRFCPEGSLSQNGINITSGIFIPDGDDVYRIDLAQDFDTKALLNDIGATINLVEMDGNLIYAYSPLIPNTVYVHGKKVNIMIFKGENAVNIGVPLLKGCY